MADEELVNIVEVEFDEDPSVPTDLLELHLELEAQNVTAEEFKEAYGQ